MTNRTDEMRDLSVEDRNERIALAGLVVHDLRPVLLEKLKHRLAFARVPLAPLNDGPEVA